MQFTLGALVGSRMGLAIPVHMLYLADSHMRLLGA